MPRIFPIIKKVTNVTGGNLPAGAMVLAEGAPSLRVIAPDMIPGQSEGVALRMTAPDAINTQTEAVIATLRNIGDSSLVQQEAVIARIAGLGDSQAVPSETTLAALAASFADSQTSNASGGGATYATPAFVKQQGQNSGTIVGGTEFTALSTPTVGNVLVVQAASLGGTSGQEALSCTDDATPPNTYTRDLVTLNSTNGSLVFFSAKIVNVPNNVTVTYGANTNVMLLVDEFSGILAGSEGGVDQTAGGSGTGTAASSGATAALTGSNDMVVGGIYCGSNGSVSAGSGYTLSGQANNAIIASTDASERKVLSGSTAAQTATFTLSSNGWVCSVVTYKAIQTGGSGAAAEQVTARISGPADTNVTPTTANTITLRAWLSASSGGTNPANANGQNDGTVATLQTTALGATTITMTSTLGANLPSGLNVTAAKYRGYFKSAGPLGTSSAKITLHSTSALFANIVMYARGSGTEDHLTGDFLFDLIAAGVDTQAKLQSCQVLHTTTDAVAGVTPVVLTVDAGCIELVGAFT